MRKYGGVPPEDKPDYDMIGKSAACGDIISTTIKCANGEVVNIIHDCTSPRPRYNNQRIQGTKGIWMGDTGTIYIEGLAAVEDEWESDEKLFGEYGHPLWKGGARYGQAAGMGHGDIDYFVMDAFIDAVRRGTQTPIDAYDAAAWMAVTCLSEDSIALGGAPVVFPDFTNGGWIGREPAAPGKYALDKVYWEYFS
jgi:hypothetical protein